MKPISFRHVVEKTRKTIRPFFRSKAYDQRKWAYGVPGRSDLCEGVPLLGFWSNLKITRRHFSLNRSLGFTPIWLCHFEGTPVLVAFKGKPKGKPKSVLEGTFSGTLQHGRTSLLVSDRNFQSSWASGFSGSHQRSPSRSLGFARWLPNTLRFFGSGCKKSNRINTLFPLLCLA